VIQSGRVSPVYLFSGPRGVGKATAALEFARALNCEDESRKPCGTCHPCKSFARLTHPDLHLLFSDSLKRTGDEDDEIRPRSFSPDKTIKIDQVRGLRSELRRHPVNAQWRAVIVLDADNMVVPAQNAFLKTLEDAPPRTVFILVTSKPSAVLPTIVSRSRRVRFTSLEEKDFSALFPDRGDDVPVLFALSEGSVGKARLYRESGLLEMRSTILRILEERDRGGFLRLLSELRSILRRTSALSGQEMFLGVFQALVRDLLLMKVEASQTLQNPDLEAELRSASDALTAREVEDLLEMSGRVEETLRRPVRPELALPLLVQPLR
jgi:DNA polymerase-3 subunit delta'